MKKPQLALLTILIASVMLLAGCKSKPAAERSPPGRSADTQLEEIMVTANSGRAVGMPAPRPNPDSYWSPGNRENYQGDDGNPIKLTREQPVSTFSIDVDTGSYANVRRLLNAGVMPPRDAVRVEELVNYFDYDYVGPQDATVPFDVTTEVAPSPWRDHSHLLHIGIKGYELDQNQRKPANLVFLIDVSGSMRSPQKLGLLKQSMKLLVSQLTENDRVAIAVYAGAAGQLLKSTGGDRKATINAAIDRLRAGGSTNGGAGIELAYDLAKQGFVKQGINRIILATDGDFNVGTTNFEKLKKRVSKQRKSGISLTTLGFGVGNYNDHLMEQMADAGDGNYFYVDTLNEGRKVLVDELSSTLQVIANDVKIQVEFNPEQIADYRLVGYENRQLQREDFNNDKVDAGDIGAGHTVTALYEITLVGNAVARVDPLRYGKVADNGQSQRQTLATASIHGDELAFLKLRYKQPGSDVSQLISQPINLDQILASLEQASAPFRFATAVAGFGQLLRGNDQLGQFDFADVLNTAQSARGEDEFGYRGEFVRLVRLAESLGPQAHAENLRGIE